MVYNSFDKKTSAKAIKKNIQNEKLAEKLHKLIIRKFEKMKSILIFLDNIWGAVLADMQLISTFNKGIRFLLCLIDMFSKYAWVISFKDKKNITITNTFQNNFLMNLTAN